MGLFKILTLGFPLKKAKEKPKYLRITPDEFMKTYEARVGDFLIEKNNDEWVYPTPEQEATKIKIVNHTKDGKSLKISRVDGINATKVHLMSLEYIRNNYHFYGRTYNKSELDGDSY